MVARARQSSVFFRHTEVWRLQLPQNLIWIEHWHLLQMRPTILSMRLGDLPTFKSPRCACPCPIGRKGSRLDAKTPGVDNTRDWPEGPRQRSPGQSAAPPWGDDFESRGALKGPNNQYLTIAKYVLPLQDGWSRVFFVTQGGALLCPGL